VCMPGAQDHKRVFDGDDGPNTGGMGAYAPAPLLTPSLAAKCAGLVQKSLDCLAKEGRPFKGVLYAGFMYSGGEMYVLEYNCRFGDPETQALLPLLASDLFEVVEACCSGSLTKDMVKWKRNCVSCAVVCASSGYPGKYPTGLAISGLDSAASADAFDGIGGVSVFQAGTSMSATGVATSGGRVLAVTGVHSTLQRARTAVYSRINSIKFEGMHYRRDIGYRAMDAPLRLGVLASTRGSSLQAVIDAIENGSLNAVIAVVISDKETAPVLERASKHNIPHMHISAKGAILYSFLYRCA
jgi:phosphoribosylamine--glycine ligase